MRSIKYIAVHCSATKPSMDVSAERIAKWHKKRGFTDIGYHYYIRRNGSIELGRDLDDDGNVIEETGAHVRGFNSVSIGICYEGGMAEDGASEDNRTQEQKMTLYNLLLVLQSAYPKAIIKGHRDFPNVAKSCPCFDVKSWCIANDINPNW